VLRKQSRVADLGYNKGYNNAPQTAVSSPFPFAKQYKKEIADFATS